MLQAMFRLQIWAQGGVLRGRFTAVQGGQNLTHRYFSKLSDSTRAIKIIYSQFKSTLRSLGLASHISLLNFLEKLEEMKSI